MQVVVEQEVNASADQLWSVIRDFKTLAENNEGIESCVLEGEGEGAIRTLLAGGLTIIERLDGLDDQARILKYSIVKGDLPVADYHAQITINEQADDSSLIHWQGQFKAAGIDDEKAETMVRGIYLSSIAGLKSFLNIA